MDQFLNKYLHEFWKYFFDTFSEIGFTESKELLPEYQSNFLSDRAICTWT